MMIRLAFLFVLFAAPALAQAHPEREFQECVDCPQMVGIPAGSFVMEARPRKPAASTMKARSMR